MRQFPLDEVITCATGRFVAKRGMHAVYDLLEYMTGDDIFRRQLADVGDECNPYLMAACPQMEQLDFTELDSLLSTTSDQHAAMDACCVWVIMEKHRLGLPDMIELSPIPKGDHAVIHPIDELRTMKPDVKIIVVKKDG